MSEKKVKFESSEYWDIMYDLSVAIGEILKIGRDYRVLLGVDNRRGDADQKELEEKVKSGEIDLSINS